MTEYRPSRRVLQTALPRVGGSATRPLPSPSALLSRNIASVSLGLAFFVLAFCNDPTYALVALQGAVALLVIAALWVIPAGAPLRFAPSVFEIVLASTILLSAFVSPFTGLAYGINYTLLMIPVLLATGILVRTFPLQSLLFIAARAHAANCALVLLIYWQQLPVILDIASADRWALRFQPFGMHPNLVGWVYGLGAIIAIYAAVKSRGVARIFYVLAAIASLTFVLGASSRAGLLATTISELLILATNVPTLPPTMRRLVMTAGIVAASAIAVFWADIFNYLSVLLELSSTTRGLGSGASGRAELWQQGLNFIAGSPQQIFFGRGLRSSDLVGFPTESAYITILIESGVILGTCIIAAILFAPVALLGSASQKNIGRTEVVFVFWLVLFAASQSLFNRYLLAIGNAGSLALLLCYAFAWLGFLQQPLARRTTPPNTRRQVVR